MTDSPREVITVGIFTNVPEGYQDLAREYSDRIQAEAARQPVVAPKAPPRPPPGYRVG